MNLKIQQQSNWLWQYLCLQPFVIIDEIIRLLLGMT